MDSNKRLSDRELRIKQNRIAAIAREKFTRKCLVKWALNECMLGYCLGKAADITTEKIHYYEIKLINHN